jgi:class 3 adenylate cyclase/Tfp pilus assembly protein PilF
MALRFPALLIAMLLAILVRPGSALAEKNELDSLKKSVARARSDTSKVYAFLELSKAYLADNPTESIRLANEALRLSSTLKFPRGIALAEKGLGLSYYNKGDYLLTLEHWNRSIEVFDSIGDQQSVANILGNLGSVYYQQGDDANALEHDLRAMKIAETLNDTLRIVTSCINIGAVYFHKKATHNKSLDFWYKALPLSILIDDKDAIGTVTVNIGELFLEQGLLDSALFYFKKSIEAFDNSPNLPYALINTGKVFAQRGEFNKALDYQKRALDFAMKLDSKSDITIALVNLANTQFESGDVVSALANFQKAEKVATETGANYELKESYQGLAKTYARLTDYKRAFQYQELLIGIKDTLFNLDIEKKLGTLQFTFDIEKKESQINLLTKDQEIKAQEIKRQKLVRNGFIGGFAVVLLFAGVFFSQRNRISKEKKRSDELLLNILPEETAEELKATGSAKAKSFESVTVMFTDFKNFTQASEILTAEELVAEINRCYSAFDSIITKYGLEKIKTIGDSYMCAGGLPVSNSTHPLDMVNASLEILSFIEENKKKRKEAGLPYFELRLGIHTGPVVAGVVGSKKFAYDIWGDTVNTASRMESSGEVGKVNISESTYNLIQEKFVCTSRGHIQAKNKGEIAMYFVDGAKV